MWNEYEVRAERDRTREQLELLFRRKAWRRTPQETLLEAKSLKADIRELERNLLLYQNLRAS
jgi:hypothetical protein